MLGAGILSWYPDPYRFDIKNTKIPFALNVQYFLKGIKAPVLWGVMVCGVFSGVDCVMENLRDESHHATYVNSVVAGAAAGMVMGSMSKRIDVMATTALGTGLLMGMIEYNSLAKSNSASAQTSETSLKEFIAARKPKPNTMFIDDSNITTELKEKYPEYKNI